MAIRKKTAAPEKRVRAEPSDEFFVKELPGEDLPSLAILRELYTAALALFALEPWKILSDSQLTLVKDPVSGQDCFCCVMGALGEVFAMQVFLGADGYRVFDAIRSYDPNVKDSIYGVASGLAVEFVPRPELSAPDRDILRALDHPGKPGVLVPRFRAQRKGYLPWFVNAGEAKLLAVCVKAVTSIVVHLSTTPGAKFWSRNKFLPLVIPKTDGEAEIELVPVPDYSKAVIEMPARDDERINRIAGVGFPSDGVFELDHFFTTASIGQKRERKACMGLSLVVDANSAAVLKPEIGKPGESVTAMLTEVLLSVIESIETIPRQVHVRNRAIKAAMEPLAKALGFQLKAAASLPAFDFAKEQLMLMLGPE